MPHHEQVTLPEGADVDAGMANLLTALWELGLRTSHSCQGTPDEHEDEWTGSEAYVLFPQAADAFEFFTRTLGALAGAKRVAQIVVDVRHLGAAKRGPAVSLEISAVPMTTGPSLRGVVRFDPELLPEVEATFAT